MAQEIPREINRDNLNAVGELFKEFVTSPGGGAPGAQENGGSTFGEWEGVFKFVERFVNQLERVEGTIGRLRNHDISTPTPPTHNTEGRIEYRDREVLVPERKLSPIKLYQAALGMLSQLPGEMTVQQMLEWARTNKDMVLTGISTNAGNFYDDGDDHD